MKIFLALASVLLLAPPECVPQAQQPLSDYWEDWGPYGACSRSCGVGVSMRTRRCVTQRIDGGNSCVGPAVSYRTCNIQDCPVGSRDFREEQCAQFDGTDFEGMRYSWLPYYGAGKPCELNCAPRGENFFYRQRPSVVDGTPCYPGRTDICVGGICMPIGCDKMLGSPHREDPCLQCGGTGESCYLIKNTFTTRHLPQAGYNQMFVIPSGATSVRIRETITTRNYIAIKNQHGEYYLNGHGVMDFSRAIPAAGTLLYYQRGIEGDTTPETIICRGPTSEPLTVELVTQGSNLGVEFEYYIPYDHTPSHHPAHTPVHTPVDTPAHTPSHSRTGYTWSSGSWSACSRECGSGFQSRPVICAIGSEVFPDHLCAAMPRPLSNRTCNAHQCQQFYSWSIGEWSACSASCGQGSQTRTVQCVTHDTLSSRLAADSHCAAVSARPATLQVCEQLPCAEYSVSSWSGCSVTCGEGTQTREVVCVGGRAERLPDSACSSLHRPHPTQSCQQPACQLQIFWHVGPWGLCTMSCGSGMRDRQVVCSDMDHNLHGVDHCDAASRPQTTETCNSQPCHSPQLVPSMQDPRGYDRSPHRFLPHIPEENSVHRPVERPVSRPHCSQTYYGCCSDGQTPAIGFQGEGCAQEPCARSSFGCCADGVTTASGPNRAGCLEDHSPTRTETQGPCHTSAYGCCSDNVTPATGPQQEGCQTPPTDAHSSACSLPSSVGPCADWTSRYYYDFPTGSCVHFWFGGCQGNRNNFLTREECLRGCHVDGSTQSRPASVPSRGPEPGSTGGSRRVFTVIRGSVRRFGSSAAAQAQRVRAPHRRLRHTPRGTAK
ncbi:hypothetical protein COCON_G00095760 [Conger conger]|uniref:BPTI/Kunitz inhibitor domain-containing protein n=1 Tax=Conger conger TaxID=82655 RepID=A0A9Q1DMV2_CONCO|nr:hypothetical protein COCON_G00095760 [Conger conger]